VLPPKDLTLVIGTLARVLALHGFQFAVTSQVVSSR